MKGVDSMLSKKKQYVTWIVGIGLSPFLFLIAFRATASIELFMNPSFYLFICLGIIVSLFPIEIKGTTIFLINSVGMAVFVSHGLFAEMILMTIATIALLIRIGVSKEESFRFPLNILMFQIVSILSAEIYYIVDSIFFPSTNYTYSILSLIIYSVSHTTFNGLLLYLISTKWQKKNYGNFFDFEYFFSIFSIIYTIPIALIILYLDDLYSTLGIVIASLPLIVISLSFKLYFFSDSQNQYLAEINSLAVKLTGKNTVNEIIELYLKSWSNIFPADTIYFFTTSDNEEISKTCAYRVGNNVSLKDSTVKTSFNYKALENFWAHNDMIVYHNSNEWSESIRKEIDYPAESVLILPIKNSETLFGFFIMTDPKRNVYTKKILSVVPVLHNYLNIAIENAQNFEKLQTNSRTDHLTGLANIRSFELHLEHFNQINPDTRFSIIIIDLDYFKDVNDSYGHQAGNELLKQVAILLNTFIYDQEKLARYGGEEFIYFLPDKSTEEAFELAEIIRSEIENTVFNTHNYLGERELVNVNITASMGLATYPDQCSNIKELLTLADRAMYIGSKQNGRNKVAFLNGGDIVDPGDIPELESNV